MIPYYQVQAFTSDPHGGNPAGVCPLESRLADDLMQRIAREIGLSETAFASPREDGDWDLRWFTPVCEVDLCGHATLATAHVLLHERNLPDGRIAFHTRSGPLAVRRHGAALELELPSRPAAAAAVPAGLAEALGAVPVAVGLARDLVVELADEDTVRRLRPDFAAISRLDTLAVCVTARGREADFVSRFFIPRLGIDEDPVTGSAHCTLVPWWAAKLGRDELVAHQVSPRGGVLHCRLDGDRVRLRGEAVTWLVGELRL